jgi:hypothetical protein
MLRAFTDFDGLHLVDFSARAQVVLSESAASTNSATRATRAYAVAVPGHGGRDYRGTFAERVWARVKIATEQIETMIRGWGSAAKVSLKYQVRLSRDVSAFLSLVNPLKA